MAAAAAVTVRHDTLITNLFSLALQFNIEYAAQIHVDGKNRGPTYITALGNYDSGQLCV